MAKNFFDVNDKTLEPSEVHRKNSDELYETAFNKDQKKVLDNFTPGGGGGNSVLEVGMTASGNTITLDKTWQEIYDAMPSVVISGELFGNLTKSVPTGAEVSDGIYRILVGGDFPPFGSYSADGYPYTEL